MFFCEGSKRATLETLGVRDPDGDLESFNAGVVVLHLGRWRSLGLAQTFGRAMALHSQARLWRLGSNPPLVLLAQGGRFEAIDARWNCDGLGWKRPTDLEAACLEKGAFVWHWSGPRKPWLRDGLYPHLWWPHVRDARCLAGLPVSAPAGNGTIR